MTGGLRYIRGRIKMDKKSSIYTYFCTDEKHPEFLYHSTHRSW